MSPRKGGAKAARGHGHVSGKEKPPITAPGRALFAVVLSPRDLDPEDARSNVKHNLSTAPPQYRIVDLEWGAVAFLGDGTPSPDAGLSHAPQVLEREDALVVLVSHTLSARAVGEAFTDACRAHAEPKARAIGLKMKLRELSVDAKFSFVLIDKVNGRVFAASTALSSPLALGHATDGTLLVTCTRSGARAATSWPPRWAPAKSADASSNASEAAAEGICRGGRRRSSGSGASSKAFTQPYLQFGQSPVTPLYAASSRASSQRSVSPERGRTDRSRSRSPSSQSESSAGTSSADWAAYQAMITTNLNHLPAGRFVYGRRYLQPFEFSAFWHSAQTNRAGARAARSVEHAAAKTATSPSGDEPTESAKGGTKGTKGGSFWGGGGGGRGEWRVKEDGIAYGQSEARDSSPTTPPDSTPKSPPMAVPGPHRRHGAQTWPGYEVTRDTRSDPSGAESRVPGARTGKWVPRGRWTNERVTNESLNSELNVGSPDGVDVLLAKTSLASPGGELRTSELTRALSQPSVLASH